MANIGKKIKSFRVSQNKTLEDIANSVGVSVPTIQRYESGVINNIPSDKIEKIAKALDISPIDLMGWNKDRDNEIIMSISETIKMFREKRGLSYAELSNISNIPKSTLQRYETGTTSKIPFYALEKIASALNTTLAKLIHGNELENYRQEFSTVDEGYLKVIIKAIENCITPEDLSVAIDFFVRVRK